jgi:asparagine synthase (glutamine-hydrolysing)
VALGGDGGDELFYGYDTFTAHKLAKMLSWVPEWFIYLSEKIVSIIPASFSNMSFDFKVKNFIKGLREKDLVIRNEIWMSAYKENELESLISKDHYTDFSKTRIDNIENILNSETSYRNDYDKLGRAYERFYMLDHVLVKVDRASMKYALEVRAPFLSTEMVDFAHSLPPEFKMSGFNRKAILKTLMKDRLPEDIIKRKKKGFGMPVAEWLNGPLKPLLTSYTDKEYIIKQKLFNFEYIQKLISEHATKKVDHRKKLWTLLTFQLWWDKWIK